MSNTVSNTHTQPNPVGVSQGKPYKGMAMEGPIARWYAKGRAKDNEVAEVLALTAELLPAGGSILEVAPGPGYLAIALARTGRYQVTGVDISRSFVEIASDKARQAGVAVDFQLGNASAMPFSPGQFDLTICRAAFKNFTEPVRALQEMHRVLRPHGRAFISDLRRDASATDIEAEVASMELNPLNAWFTREVFRRMLLRNAYSRTDIEGFVRQTEFAECTITETNVSLHILLTK